MQAVTGEAIASRTRNPRIAIASSGLGHVHRGIETWATDLGRALNRQGHAVTLFQGAGSTTESWQNSLDCWKRTDERTQRLVRSLGRVGWRLGAGSGYDVEQTSFSLKLWPQLRREFDLLHVQDPRLALLLDRLHRAGLSRAKVILAHGTEETPQFLRRISVLQHLAPCYLDDWSAHSAPGQQVFAVPNFVDVEQFAPGDRAAARRAWDLPQGALVVLCVAAIKRGHKRVDYLIDEFATFAERLPRPAILVVAGGREAETDAVMAHGHQRLGDRVRFLTGVQRDRIPSLYQAADLFALASLHEMMPIALLEALASGLPIAANDTPTLRWMVGSGGRLTTIREPGGLVAQLEALAPEQARRQFAQAARSEAVDRFSEPVVLAQILDMYAAVLARKTGRPS